MVPSGLTVHKHRLPNRPPGLTPTSPRIPPPDAFFPGPLFGFRISSGACPSEGPNFQRTETVRPVAAIGRPRQWRRAVVRRRLPGIQYDLPGMDSTRRAFVTSNFVHARHARSQGPPSRREVSTIKTRFRLPRRGGRLPSMNAIRRVERTSSPDFARPLDSGGRRHRHRMAATRPRRSSRVCERRARDSRAATRTARGRRPGRRCPSSPPRGNESCR